MFNGWAWFLATLQGPASPCSPSFATLPVPSSFLLVINQLNHYGSIDTCLIGRHRR